jgi:hypothetical protein
VIDTFQIGLVVVEVITKLVQIRPDDMLGFLEKERLMN